MSALLSRPWEQIEDYIDRLENTPFEEVQKHFCLTSFNLELIERGRRLKKGRKPVWSDDDLAYVVDRDEDLEKFDWGYESESAPRIVFVPFDYLP